MNYNVSFTGSNIPSSLYTLQGSIGCGSSSHFFNLPNNGGIGTATSTSNQWSSNSDCYTATVSSLNCNAASILINGPGISTQTVTFPITYAILPVELKSFTATKDGDRVTLKWTTATEINNNYFMIERSADGNHWQEIKRMSGAGNSTSEITYEWGDEAPLTGTSYYRLGQTSMDGHIAYSETKILQYSTDKNKISIYPIPNAGNTITISGISNYNNHELTVINSTGANLVAIKLSSSQVTLPKLDPGIYIIGVKNMLSGKVNYLHYVQL